MKIWIDGDACPKAIKQILFRAAIKRKVIATIVANHVVETPPSIFVKRVQVEKGFDKADKYITSKLEPKDLVITADILLADEVITREGIALNPRGKLYTAQNMKDVLAMRNLSEVLRESGAISGGQDALSAKEVQAFSNNLDRIITAAQA